MTSAKKVSPTYADYSRVISRLLEKNKGDKQSSKDWNNDATKWVSPWEQWQSDCKFVEDLQGQFEGFNSDTETMDGLKHFFGMLDKKIADKFDRLFAVR